VPAQILVGDLHGLNTFEHQPIKVAAMEGAWETERGAPLYLFAIPDQNAETNHLAISIPRLASIILTHDPNGEVMGLTEVPPEERPPVFIVFWAFRIMVAIGTVMLGIVLWSLWARRKGRLFDPYSKLLRVLVWMIPAPFVAVLAGWFVTEVGRFPWLVYGEMNHLQGVTPALTGGMALSTLLGYIAVYALVGTAGVYYLLRIVRDGPERLAAHVVEPRHAKRPLSAPDVALDPDTGYGRGS